MDNEIKTVQKKQGIFGGNTRLLVVSALLVAMSIVLGKFAQIPIGDSIRISFENLPLLMAGIFFGPVSGAVVGVSADLIGCVLKGYTINPFITVGACLIGLVSGIVFKYGFKCATRPSAIAASVYSAHIIGSVIVKSIGLFIYFHTPLPELLLRLPIYIVIGGLEFYIINMMLSNHGFIEQVRKVKGK